MEINVTLTDAEHEILNTIVSVWGEDGVGLKMHGHASYKAVYELLTKLKLDIPETLDDIMSGKFEKDMKAMLD